MNETFKNILIFSKVVKYGIIYLIGVLLISYLFSLDMYCEVCSSFKINFLDIKSFNKEIFILTLTAITTASLIILSIIPEKLKTQLFTNYSIKFEQINYNLLVPSNRSEVILNERINFISFQLNYYFENITLSKYNNARFILKEVGGEHTKLINHLVWNDKSHIKTVDYHEILNFISLGFPINNFNEPFLLITTSEISLKFPLLEKGTETLDFLLDFVSDEKAKENKILINLNLKNILDYGNYLESKAIEIMNRIKEIEAKKNYSNIPFKDEVLNFLFSLNVDFKKSDNYENFEKEIILNNEKVLEKMIRSFIIRFADSEQIKDFFNKPKRKNY